MSVSRQRILTTFGVMDRGGAELRTLELLRALDPERYELHFCVLSGRPGTLDDEIRALGGKIHYCALGRGFGRRFRKLLRDEGITVLHSNVHMFSGYLLRLARMERVPGRVAHFRTSEDGQRTSLRRMVQRGVMRHWVDRHSTDILGVSESALRLAWSVDWRRDPRCRVVYSGLPARGDALEGWQARRAEFGIAPEVPLCIHVGRFNPVKNHRRVIQVFAALRRRRPDAHLLLVGGGGGAARESMLAAVAQAGVEDAVTLAGERADVVELLAAADAMIFPSFFEGLPGAVLEACSVGLPVLASDLPVVLEVAAHCTCVQALSLDLSDERWAEKLAAMLRAPGHPDRRRAVDEFAAGVFQADRFVRAHCEVWDHRVAASRR